MLDVEHKKAIFRLSALGFPLHIVAQRAGVSLLLLLSLHRSDLFNARLKALRAQEVRAEAAKARYA